MSLTIGTTNFDVSQDFRKSLERVIKNDKVLDQSEINSLKVSALTTGDKEALKLLESQSDNSSVRINLDDTTEGEPADIQFRLGKRGETVESAGPADPRFNFSSTAIRNQENEQNVPSLNTAKVSVATLSALNKIFSKDDVQKIQELFNQIPDEAVRKSIDTKISEILNNQEISPAKQKELIGVIRRETGNFIKSQEYYKTQADDVLPQNRQRVISSLEESIGTTKSEISKLQDEIKIKGSTPELEEKLKGLNDQLTRNQNLLHEALSPQAKKALVAPLKNNIQEIKDQVGKLEAEIKIKGSTPGLETQLKALNAQLETQKKALDIAESGAFVRREKAVSDAFDKNNTSRLNDILDSLTEKFGPPYNGIAGEVNDFIGKNPQIKSVFASPEDVNRAIRRRPADLSEIERSALKKIRESFFSEPPEGKIIIKIFTPDSKGVLPKDLSIKGFVIDPERLKGIKNEQDLINTLRLDFGSNSGGIAGFKLSDVKVKISRVLPGELTIPFSREFGGTRDIDIYGYPYAGNGFTTPKKGFPVPESDLGKKKVTELADLNFQEFLDKPLAEINALGLPKVEAPTTKTETPKAAEIKPDGETPSASAERPRVEADTRNPRETVPDNKESPKVSEPDKAQTPPAEASKPTDANGINKRIDDLKLDKESKELLIKLSESPEFKANPKSLNNILDAFEKAGSDPKTLEILNGTLKTADKKILVKAFDSPESGGRLLAIAQKLLPIFEKYGLPAAEVIGKAVKGLVKALPVLGGVMSGYDTVRMMGIAKDGKDISSGASYISYPPGDARNTPENLEKLKDLRALALIGAGANGLDTFLSVIEATGVGNIDLPIQLGLAGAEVVIDIALDYFRENPDKMPKALSLGIRATALATAIAFAPAGTAAVANIYGLDGTIGIANELTSLVGNEAIKGIKALTDLSAKGLDRDLATFAKGVDGLADLIRNPQKYADALGKKVEDIVAEASDLLKNQIAKGNEVAKKALTTIVDIAANPKKYSKAAADLALDLGKKAISGLKNAGEISISFAKELVKKGVMNVDKAYEYLKTATVNGAQLAKKFIVDAANSVGQLGKEALDFMKDFYQNPKKYDNMAYEAISNIKDAIANGSSVAFNKLKQLADSGISLAKTALIKSIDAAYNGSKWTYDMVKYAAQNPAEAGTKLVTATKDFLINAANSGKQLYNDSLVYLEKLYERTGGALGKFSDTLVDLAKKGGGAVQEIFTKHFAVIKNRLPEILSSLQNLGGAALDRVIQSVPGAQLTAALLNNGVQGFKSLITLASKYGTIASEFSKRLSQDIKNALSRVGFTDLSPIKNLLRKYYDQAVAIGGVAAIKARQLIYNEVRKLDAELANGKIPDFTYNFIKP